MKYLPWIAGGAALGYAARRGRRPRRSGRRNEPLQILMDYLAGSSEAEQGRELAVSDGYAFSHWVRTQDGSEDQQPPAAGWAYAPRVDVPYWLARRVMEVWEGDLPQWQGEGSRFDALRRLFAKLPNDIFKLYLEQADTEADDPSYRLLRDPKPFPRNWLVHFTDNAEPIAGWGFLRGRSDYTELGLTTWLPPAEGPGYNFAFAMEDASSKGTQYGNEAVIFTAPGVEVWHTGDRERQIVFWGADARNRMAAWQENGQWCAGGGICAATIAGLAKAVAERHASGGVG